MFGKDSFGNSPFDRSLDDVMDGEERVIENGGNYSSPRAPRHAPTSALDVMQTLYIHTLHAVMEIERMRQEPREERSRPAWPGIPQSNGSLDGALRGDEESQVERDYEMRVDMLVAKALRKHLAEEVSRVLEQRETNARRAAQTVPAETEFTLCLMHHGLNVGGPSELTGTAEQIVAAMMATEHGSYAGSWHDYLREKIAVLTDDTQLSTPAIDVTSSRDASSLVFIRWLVASSFAYVAT